MAKVTIDGVEVEVESGISLIKACEIAGVEIPRFCYHDRLQIAGNCRMCLVEVEKSPRLVASCAMPVSDGMVVHTNTPTVKKAREGVLEFLLINHPLECPICDKGGECDLQDQSYKYGKGTNKFRENKRSVKNKNMGPLIQTHMTRCIHCTRCIRFMTDIAGTEELGTMGRGEHAEVTTYLEKSLTSELSGNIIDICPVGALNSQPYAYTARKWELKSTDSIDVFDAMGCNIKIDSRGLEVMRILPRICEDINEEWISDKTRFSYDALKRQRIDAPFIKNNGKLVRSNWDQALAALSAKIKSTDSSEIGAIAGDMADAESMYGLKMLLGKLGSNYVDFNQFGYKFDYSNRGNYLFNSGFSGIELADLILIVGANIRKNAPVLGARINKLVRFNGLKVARIGEKDNQTFPISELGDDIDIISEIEEGSHEFCNSLRLAKNPLIIIGDGIYSRKDSVARMANLHSIAKKYGVVTESFNGFNILHNHASTVGAIDLGFVAKNEDFSAKNMAEKITNGELEILFLLGADEIDISKDHKGFVVYIGHHGDKSAHIADIILPSSTFAEKNATYINNEGKIQSTRLAVLPPHKAISDAEIIFRIAKTLELSMDYEAPDSLSKSLKAKIAKLNEMPRKISFKEKNGTLLPNKIESRKFNFYLTNSISRSSPTMAVCAKKLAEGDL